MKDHKANAKKAAGYTAADLIQDGMTIGLGTGSTAFYFIERLAARCKKGLKIHAIASSENSWKLAKSSGIPLLDPYAVSTLDITVDGADEIDSLKRMIKGGGGALVREKIMASMSREMIVVIDQEKLVSHLGKHKLPVEVIPFGCSATLHKLERLGYHGKFRAADEHSLFLTDNGNYIIDIQFDSVRDTPEKDHERIMQIPGVVDTGFFFHLAGRVIVGFDDGQVVIR